MQVSKVTVYLFSIIISSITVIVTLATIVQACWLVTDYTVLV